MENLYYTPDITEFHIGFKFQLSLKLGLENSDPDKLTWSNFTFNTSTVLKNIQHAINNGEIRVKYLDRKDIESFGCIHVGGKLLNSALQYYTLKEDVPNSFIQLHYSQNRKSLKVYRSRDVTGVDPMEMLYQGTLNNKSEFKKLMAQLGVEIKVNEF